MEKYEKILWTGPRKTASVSLEPIWRKLHADSHKIDSDWPSGKIEPILKEIRLRAFI